MNHVGQKLAKVSNRSDLPYEFVIVNHSIPNAWALPGGKIAIHRGLLLQLQTEAELAAVLSHEIVHSAARHGAKSLERSIFLDSGLKGMQEILSNCKYEDLIYNAASLGTEWIQLKYSRDAELEADLYGIQYMHLAGYDLQAAVDLQKMFLQLSQQADGWSLFATHPPTRERIEKNEKALAQYQHSEGNVGKEEYRNAIRNLQKTKRAYECLDLGYECLRKKEYENAKKLAEEGIAIAPEEAHLYALQAKVYFAEHNPEKAYSLIQQAISLNSSYFDFFLLKGKIEMDRQMWKEARKSLEKSYQLLPTKETISLMEKIENIV